ncbi:MAG: Txe/YoeB family addiction module toxin [Saprospiraceae bacterium]
MKIQFTQAAFQQFLEWQDTDEDTFRKIRELIKEVARNPFKGIGKPEPLKGNLKGFWSRRITREHRLVYKVEADNIFISSCFGHYDE